MKPQQMGLWASKLMGVMVSRLLSFRSIHPRKIRGAENFVLVSVSIGIVALYSSFRRPIWYDEWLHFVWGAFPLNIESLALVWTTTRIEIDGCCHAGATPTYMMINLVLLNIFGAEEIALRLPSLLAGLWLLFCTLTFFKDKKFSFIWQLSAILLLACSQGVMYYVGESRSYMPLVAGVVGVATYYTSSPSNKNQKKLTTIAWVSGVLGSLFHPYMLLYCFALAIAFALFDQFDRKHSWSWRSFTQRLNLPLLIAVSGISLGFYFFGWGGTGRSKIDPYTFIPQEQVVTYYLSSMRSFMDTGLFSPLPALLLGGLATFSLVTYLFNTKSLRTSTNVLAPLTLAFVALSTGGLIIASSILNGFWLIQRQWVASQALFIVAFVWLIAAVASNFGAHSQRMLIYSRLFSAVFLSSLALLVVPSIADQLSNLKVYESEKNALGLLLIKRGVSDPEDVWATASNFEEAANLNLYLGGSVWKQFDYAYERFRSHSWP